MAVCVYKARIHVISGRIDLFRIFSRDIFSDFYNLPMINQKISDKDVLCYRCVKYSILNANHLKPSSCFGCTQDFLLRNKNKNRYLYRRYLYTLILQLLNRQGINLPVSDHCFYFLL